MIVLVKENVENKVVFNQHELNLLNKINIKDTDMILDTVKKINRYICEKYNVSAICMIDKEIEKEDSEILDLKDKIYQYSQRLT